MAIIIGQRHIHKKDGIPPIRYEAIKECLSNLDINAKSRNASVNISRIGCGHAGGTSDRIEPLIEATLLAASVPGFVYDFEYIAITPSVILDIR